MKTYKSFKELQETEFTQDFIYTDEMYASDCDCVNRMLQRYWGNSFNRTGSKYRQAQFTKEDWQDTHQTALMNLWKTRKNPEYFKVMHTEKFGAIVYTIVKHAVHSLYRKHRRKPLDTMLDDKIGEDTETSYIDTIAVNGTVNLEMLEKRKAITEVLKGNVAQVKKASPLLLQVGRLYMQGYMPSDMAEKLNISLSKAQGRTAKFFKYCRDKFDELDGRLYVPRAIPPIPKEPKPIKEPEPIHISLPFGTIRPYYNRWIIQFRHHSTGRKTIYLRGNSQEEVYEKFQQKLVELNSQGGAT